MSTTENGSPTSEETARKANATARRNVAGGAALLMGGILLSRILGLVRDSLIAHQFGQGFDTDVYNAAFTIPDLLFFLLAGGAFSGAFTPVFTEYITTGRKKEAWRIFSAVSAIMFVVIAVLIVLGEIFAVPLVRLTNPGYELIPGKIEQTVLLTRILLPAQICFFLGGLMMSTLNARNNFTGQALGPVVYNIGIILGALFLAKPFGIAGLCIGAIGGAIVGNLGLQWFLVRRTGGYFVPLAFLDDWRHPGVRKVGTLMLPVILGLALPQVSTIIGKIFAASLGNGPQSALMNANRLMQVPLAVFAQSIATASLPTMSAQYAQRDFAGMRTSVSFAIRSILFLTLPASLVMLVLALPIVQVMLQSGAFTTADAELTAGILRWFAIGIFAWSGHSIVTRGFYALQESKVPIIVGTIVTIFFIPLNWPLRNLMGVSGLALATSIAATVHMVTLLFLLRIRLNGLDGTRLLTSTGKMLLASGVTALLCVLVRNGMENVTAPLHPVRLQAGVVVLVCLVFSALVYIGLALLLKMEEVNIVRRLLRRFVR